MHIIGFPRIASLLMAVSLPAHDIYRDQDVSPVSLEPAVHHGIVESSTSVNPKKGKELDVKLQRLLRQLSHPSRVPPQVRSRIQSNHQPAQEKEPQNRQKTVELDQLLGQTVTR